MAQFAHPLHDHILTRGFHYPSASYVGGQHAAADYIRRTGPTCRASIMAAASGTVAGVGWDFYSGFFVAVDHAGGWRSWYRHMYGGQPVAVGQQVAQGQVVGYVGSTGQSEGDHLHFDLWCAIKHDPTAFAKRGLWAHDPELYLGQEDNDMALQQTVEAHQRIIDNLWARTKGLEEARDSLIREVAALQQQQAVGGGVSEERVKMLIRAARLSI